VCGKYGRICGGYNTKGRGTYLQKTYRVPAGVYQVSFDFVKIDSWDGERAYVNVNNRRCYNSPAFRHNQGQQVCGQRHNWYEMKFRINCRNQRVTGSGLRSLTVRIWTSLNEHASNESFGIDNVRITGTVTKASSFKNIAESFNTGSSHGWNCVRTTVCGKYGRICGGYNTKGRGTYLQKTYRVPAGVYQVSFDFVKIDSWDGERAYVNVNNRRCYNSPAFRHNQGQQVCGQRHNWYEMKFRITCRNQRVSGSGLRNLTVRIWTSLNEHATNESFGIDNVAVQKTG